MFQSSRLGVLCLLLVACVSSAVGMDVYDDPTLIIATASGPIQGYHSEYANLTARAWLGIPYASPPNGTLRFKPPTPPESWSQLRDASVAGPGCQQSCSLPPGLCPPVLSEDCLYLNVFAPESMDGTLLPVMIWIHGGNFRQGSGSTGMYDGTVFVNSTQVILVTINYRLGALGFFWNQDSPANNGLLDQQMAMQWVQKNIFNFGGDATRVTIFGQSAGGTSVSCHLQNSVSRSLFSRAIIQSVPLGIPVRFPNEAKALNQIFAQALNCSIDDTKCLQAADIPNILTATGHAAGQLGPNMQHLLEIAQAWQPTLQMNSFNIPLPLTEYFQQYPGDKPLMIGTTSQEAYLFIYELINSSMSSLATAALEAVIFGFNSVGPLGQLYPLSSSSDNRDALSELASDELFLCAAGNATDGMVASAPQTPIFLYQYDHVAVDGAQGWGPHYKVCWTKVCHGADVPMVFGSADAGGSTFSEDEWVLSSYMRAYWGNFATNGNPNVGEPVPLQWPQVTKARETMHFVTGELEIIQNANGNKCEYLDTLGYTL